jgi:hypothetical protein
LSNDDDKVTLTGSSFIKQITQLMTKMS